MLDINTIDSDISKIDVTQLRRMITMENKVFEDMYRLMLYDNSQPNFENNKVVKAYIDSQVRALNHIEKLLDKHKLVLDELNKTTRVIEENNIKNIKSNEKNEQDNKDELSLFEEVEENLE
ncbi:hypothetical protein [Megamonas rupellensis]|jgi:hypothetical protein|uniref:hypothetical protein n=1 Tax=Megamonas rupellensis TaxID=491921 RepID=UPI00241E36EF|nr:hypothetical protein [Megamonas rupellensis]